MNKVLLCEPNFSEGRDAGVIEQVTARLRAAGGVRLLDANSDADHNRTVLTYLGPPEDVLAATEAAAGKAIELIDMSVHSGSHPRMGAVDVVPFVPVRDMEMSEAVAVARRFGEFLGALGVPVYYYEAAATREDRRTIPQIRSGEYEALPAKLAEADWAPDAGPAEFNAKSGATITGARMPLLAFNVDLDTTDLAVADAIARAVRHSSGGLPHVRAIALTLQEANMVQVSMNLTDFRRTPIALVMEAVRTEAAARGVSVARVQLVGPVPLEAVTDVFKHYLQAIDFSADQIIENALID